MERASYNRWCKLKYNFPIHFWGDLVTFRCYPFRNVPCLHSWVSLCVCVLKHFEKRAWVLMQAESGTCLSCKYYDSESLQDLQVRWFNPARASALCRSAYLFEICLLPSLRMSGLDNVEWGVARATGTPPDCWTDHHLSCYCYSGRRSGHYFP